MIEFKSSDIVEMHDALDLERFEADRGYVRPCCYQDTNISIMPFQRCSELLKQVVASAILNAWPEESNGTTIDEVESYILRHWSAGDLMYVCTENLSQPDHVSFIGCVAIDTTNFFPCLSHLYVDEKYRHRGFSKVLIEFAETVMVIHKFPESRLWCRPSLHDFYSKQGYTTDGNQDGHLIMKKTLTHCKIDEPLGVYGDESMFAGWA